ncbi:sulfite exporter TauE/SafE family protein [Polaribacter sp. BAL334]|uniref:sulfite exporter TauE/SafE family protein n=1 Tax=Polaribacter sp. BAL334 TaxID=1708178 RepID=UPI0018D1F735|nr:sulfite exporter TauE/SafE family protein [Polaribacter sp. BAL334]MBG7613435.1 sulfite exporter TauE/SafE family protein [Polaribacter sp. BAL334]
MLISALIFGLVGSFHCVGMCGPIAFMLPVDRDSPIKKALQILSYHLGRLFTYSLMGILFGYLGKGFFLFGFQQQIAIITGVLMILLVVFPKITAKIPLSKVLNQFVFKVKNALGNELKKKNNDTFFVLGFLNGLLPCGLVYMAILGALTTSTPISGAFYMFLFGLGTIPLMTVVVYFGSFTKGNFRTIIQKAIPVVVVFMGVLFILRGLGLGIPFLSPPEPVLTSAIETVKSCH